MVEFLFELKKRDNLTVIALTATPPYDSDALEITKYFKLCGEVDDEIVVPDLVKEKDLCPHQDYVYFSAPNDTELNFISEFRSKISHFIDVLLLDNTFTDFIKQHRFLTKTNDTLDQIYSNPEYFSSLLIFLKATGNEVLFEKFELLGFKKKDKIDVPIFDLNWASVLLQNILINDRKNLFEQEALLEQLEIKVRKLHIFDKSKIDFVGDKVLYRSLANSFSKLESIVQIIKHEQNQLKDDLRVVVLSDFIKREFLEVGDLTHIDRLGVLPIFHFLKSNVDNKENLAVLTGSIVIIHSDKIFAFDKFDLRENYSFSPVVNSEEFVQVKAQNSSSKLVETITKMFENGDITKLVGTKSLLGEGWDAPSINTLILASFVGSFVSSNQMRGRAIRTQKNNPSKTGNIWHLVCIDKTNQEGGKDIETLLKRFDAFVGISNTSKPFIESGIDRLELPFNYENVSLDALNKTMLDRASLRNELHLKWENAIRFGTNLSREIKQYYNQDLPFPEAKEQKFKDIVKYGFIEIGIGLSLFIPELLMKNIDVLITKGILSFFYSIVAGLGLAYGYKTIKAVKSYLQFGFLVKNIHKITEAILQSFIELKSIKTARNKIDVTTEILTKGDVIIKIKGTNDFESSIFINAIQEIIEPIQNPRYLIINTNWFRNELNVENFYAVPQFFAEKKNKCLVFEKHWNNFVGNSQFIYTRHLEGRKLLLKARLLHMSNAFKKNTKKAVIWS
jgi:superfamily II DNA or RNA helicase